jgi:spermidine synthase
VLAFCSIVYELLLGQALTAFLGNTVLRYSVTIGLYMLSMGLGALLVRRSWLERAVVSLQLVELALTVLGGAAVLLLFAVDALAPSPLAVGITAHALVVAIGILTGLEIPLLIALKRGEEHATSDVLGADYLGAFLGTLAFAFLFYPAIGLVRTSLTAASLNAIVGVGLLLFSGRVEAKQRRRHRWLVAIQLGLFALLVAGLAGSTGLEELTLSLYLR